MAVKFDFLGGYGLHFYIYKHFLIYSRNSDWIGTLSFDLRKLIDSKDKEKISKNSFNHISDIAIVVTDLWFWVSKNWGARWIHPYDTRGCDSVLPCSRDPYGSQTL